MSEIKINSIRYKVNSQDIPFHLTKYSDLTMVKNWLIEVSGRCWTDVTKLELLNSPDKMSVTIVGYFD